MLIWSKSLLQIYNSYHYFVDPHSLKVTVNINFSKLGLLTAAIADSSNILLVPDLAFKLFRNDMSRSFSIYFNFILLSCVAHLERFSIITFASAMYNISNFLIT